MRSLQDYWKRLPPRWRLFFLASATCGVAALGTIELLLRKEGVREVLYKAF